MIENPLEMSLRLYGDTPTKGGVSYLLTTLNIEVQIYDYLTGERDPFPKCKYILYRMTENAIKIKNALPTLQQSQNSQLHKK